MSFFSEIKRRNVFRVGVAYLASAWLFFEVLSSIFNVIGSPDWLLQSILALLAVGFPVALMFSWVYEITPEGLKRTRDVDNTESITPAAAKRLDQLTIGVVVVAIAVLVVDRFRLASHLPSEPASAVVGTDRPAVPVDASADSNDSGYPSNSIAVLPFADMGAVYDGHSTVRRYRLGRCLECS